MNKTKTMCYVTMTEISNTPEYNVLPKAARIYSTSGMHTIIDKNFHNFIELNDFVIEENNKLNISISDINQILRDYKREVEMKMLNPGDQVHLTKKLYIRKTNDHTLEAITYNDKSHTFVPLRPQVTSHSFVECEKNAIKAYDRNQRNMGR